MRESKMKRQERVRPPGRVLRPDRMQQRDRKTEGKGAAKSRERDVASQDKGCRAPHRRSHRKRSRSRPTRCPPLREEADERAAAQRVDEPFSLRQLGHRVLAQRHVETCVHDRSGAGQVSGVCGTGAAAGLARAAAQHAGFTQRLRGRAAHPPFSAVADPPKVASAAW